MTAAAYFTSPPSKISSLPVPKSDTTPVLAVAVQIPNFPVFLYAPPRVRLGRGMHCDVILLDDKISRHHSDLWLHEQQLWLTKENSPKGIFPQDQQTAPRLMPEDGIQLGQFHLCAWLEDIPAPLQRELEEARTTKDTALIEQCFIRGGDWLRAAASNPATPSALLARFATAPDRATLQAITANPNTPRGEIFRLGSLFSEEFWSNPQVLFLLMEDPEFRACSTYELCSLLGSPRAPLEHLRHFLQHPSEIVRDFAERSLKARGAFRSG